MAEMRTLLEANLYDKRLATDEAVKLRHSTSVGRNSSAFTARKAVKNPKDKEPLWQRLGQCPVPLLMLYGENDRDAARRAARARELQPRSLAASLRAVRKLKCGQLMSAFDQKPRRSGPALRQIRQ